MDLRLLDPERQRTFLLLYPSRISLVTKVTAPLRIGDLPRLTVHDGPTNCVVHNLEAA